jgi:hypothetical protein
MNVKCETHTSKEAVAVCHHCGRPVCNLIKLSYRVVRGMSIPMDQLCGYIIDDPAFAWPSEDVGVQAIHCQSCLISQHKEFASSLERLKARL